MLLQLLLLPALLVVRIMLVLCEAGPVGEQHPVKGRVGRTDDQAQDVVESKELEQLCKPHGGGGH